MEGEKGGDGLIEFGGRVLVERDGMGGILLCVGLGYIFLEDNLGIVELWTESS